MAVFDIAFKEAAFTVASLRLWIDKPFLGLAEERERARRYV